jgi:hypothetical protein
MLAPAYQQQHCVHCTGRLVCVSVDKLFSEGWSKLVKHGQLYNRLPGLGTSSSAAPCVLPAGLPLLVVFVAGQTGSNVSLTWIYKTAVALYCLCCLP